MSTAATTPAETHAADQAGGDKEVVFSSDGIEPIQIQFPVNDNAHQNDDLDTSAPMTAEQAFEVFAGKLYVANPYAKKTTTDDSKEGLLQRLGRLKQELEELQEDTKGGDAETAAIFQDQLAQLQEQLQSLSTAQLQKQERLTNLIQNSVLGIQQGDKTAPPTTTASSTVPPPQPQHLEERLKQLELTLGAAGTTSHNKSLLDRLEALEQVQAKLDDKKVDLVQKRVKVIRQDLEAAAKARNKLMSSASSNSNVEDSKSIAALYDQLQLLQGVSQHLPALTARLQSLAHQHVDGATAAARLQAVEQLVASSLAPQVASVETAVQQLETSLAQNAQALQENVQALEDRIKALS